MRARLRGRRPTPAFVIACIPLFVAMSGVAYASVSSNSVRSRHIVNDAVTSADIKGGGGRAGDIKNRDVNPLLAVAKGFATVDAVPAGQQARVLNFGGQQTATPSGVSVQRVGQGTYDVTFDANSGTGRFARVDSVDDLAVSGMAVRPQFVGGVVPVVSWLKTSSSASENQIKLRLVIENANSGNTLDTDFTVLFYARTTS
jgi:hypothetical protein